MMLSLTSPQVEIHVHVTVTRLEIRNSNLAVLHCKDSNGYPKHFILTDKDNIREIRFRFRPGTLVNIASENGIINRIFKGIDTEV